MTDQLRQLAHAELHARPFPRFDADWPILLMCVQTSPDQLAAVWAWLQLNIPALPPKPTAGAWTLQSGQLDLRVEQHTEFLAISWRAPGGTELAPDWLAAAPMDILVLTHFVATDAAALAAHGASSSSLLGGTLQVATDFAIDPQGLCQWRYAFTQPQTPDSRGRAMQMLMEVETYRVLSLIQMDKVRAAHPALQAIAKAKRGDSDPTELALLERNEHELDALWQSLNWRVSACRAYHDLVFQRLLDLDDQRLGELPSVTEFLRRRMTPAIATSETVMRRHQELAQSISRRANLVRTRLQLNLETQNSALLSSLKQTAQRQIRLQSTVEGLSTVAISYYALGLLSAAIAPWVDKANAGLVKTALVPLVIGAVWLTLQRIKRKLDT